MKGFHQNPFFYFGILSVVLLSLLFISSDSLAKDNYSAGTDMVFFNSFFDENGNNVDAFVGQNNGAPLETPDLKIVQDNSLAAVSTPNTLTTQSLGDIFGGSDSTRTDVEEYTVQAGDTVQSVALHFNLTKETIAVANDISVNTGLKNGDTLIILPADGVLHIVKSGDTIEGIAKLYKTKAEDILAYNNSDPKLYIGQPVFVFGGKMPQKTTPKNIVPKNIYSNLAILPNSLFMPPLLNFIETQGLHYFNAVDMASHCGDPVYAAASGTVEKVMFDRRYGNQVVIAHENGARTSYGHLAGFQVVVGQHVTIGDQIATEGRTGTEATGCHVHFQVMGGFANPWGVYPAGSRFVNGNLVH